MLRHIVCGGDVPAEHHGVIAVFEQLTCVLEERCQLGVARLTREALSRGDQCLQARSVLQLGWRLQVTARQVICFAVMQALIGQQFIC